MHKSIAHLRSIPLLSALLLAAAAPSPAQQAEPRATDAALAERMGAFLRLMKEDSRDSMAVFFPRRGDWTWVQTRRDPQTGARIGTGVWRFPAAETLRAIGAGGPVCSSFDQPYGEFGPFEGFLGMRVRAQPTGWRRVDGSRFVPPGESPRSSAFVEWRREDGAWVLSAFGDDAVPFTEPAGVPRSMIVRDTLPLPAGGDFAAEADWITFEGYRYVKHGQPRKVDAKDLSRLGRFGRVPVFVPRGHLTAPELLYVPVRPGEYQPYEAVRPQPCR